VRELGSAFLGFLLTEFLDVIYVLSMLNLGTFALDPQGRFQAHNALS
jgi:hypothetical protein